MGNSSITHLPSYDSCTDGNISTDSITSEYWDTASINPDFKMATIVMATVLLLYLIIGLPSNVILIFFIISKHLKEPTHILLLNLAIADVLLCGILMPFGIVSGYAGGFVFGNTDKIRCQVCQFGLVFTALSAASLNILGVISIDRFVYFKYPLRYDRIFTVTKTVIIMIFIWLFSALQSILPLFGFGEIRFVYALSLCHAHLYGGTHITKNVYYVLLLVILGLFPIITIIVTNAWIVTIVKVQIKKLYKTRRSFRNKNELQDLERTVRKEIAKAKNKKQLALLRTFGTILIANLITWVPLIILSLITFIIDIDNLPIGIHLFIFLTFISHSVLHPIIEGCLIPEHKKNFKKILCPCKKQDKEGINAEEDGSTSCCRSCLDMCSFALLSESQVVIDIDTNSTSAGKDA